MAVGRLPKHRLSLNHRSRPMHRVVPVLACNRPLGELMQIVTGSSRNYAKTGGPGSWAFWMRPRSYWDVIVYHLPLAVISGSALFLPYVVKLRSLPLIPCTFLRITGISCPFCGFTRSFWAIAAGEWGTALTNCPLAFGVYFFTVFLFIWNVSALISGIVLLPGPIFRSTPARRRRIAGYVCGLFLLNWGYRLIMGLT